MDSIHSIVIQEQNEERFNRKHIDKKIRDEIEANPQMMERITLGVILLDAYFSKSYYDSKNRRLAQLQGLDLTELVTDLFIGIAYSQKPELFASIAALMASRLKLSDQTEAVTTVAEMLAILCETDAFDITKAHKGASLMIVSRVPLSDELVVFIENSQYLPPMVCSPLELTHNYSSGYLTHNDSLMLGSGNHHDGDFCLDVLNIMNNVALRLDTEFLSKVEEKPTFTLSDQESIDQWTKFKKRSYAFYTLMAQQGNRFYLTHKVDKRGRIYSCGYHINTQGPPFKKAMLELANKQLVEGVPT